MRSHLVVAVVLLALAALILLACRALPFGTVRVPQAGFFPTILASLLLMLAVLSLVDARRASGPDLESAPISAANWWRLGFILTSLAGFAVMLERFGFLLSSFLLMLALLRAVEAQSWSRMIFTGFAAALISYLIFARLLGVALPTGLLGL